MGYGLVDVFEFWEYEVTCFYRHQFRSFRRVREHVSEIETRIIRLSILVSERRTRTNTLRTTGAQRELL